MMHIFFAPQRRDGGALAASRQGDVLTLDGDALDLSSIPEGATLPAYVVHPMLGEVSRIDGELHIQLLLPYGPTPEPWQTHPEPMIVADDGPIDVPCDTIVEVAHLSVEGGIEIVTTTKRWRQEPEVATTFVAAPAPEPEESADDND